MVLNEKIVQQELKKLMDTGKKYRIGELIKLFGDNYDKFTEDDKRVMPSEPERPAWNRLVRNAVRRSPDRIAHSDNSWKDLRVDTASNPQLYYIENNDRNFGHIQGHSEGSIFDSRDDIKSAGLHGHNVNGISRILGTGCDCIVLNGGYVDDRDYGDEIWYTGEGGQEPGKGKVQLKHQELIRGNLDLSKNKDSGYPIRVIRGHKHFEKRYAPKEGYRYDGLYYLDSYWPEVGEQGYRIWRYKLVKEQNTELPPSRENIGPAPRKKITTKQIQRDTKIPVKLKKLYDYKCQICEIRLQATGREGVEGSHIKGLGKPHNGPDKSGNMIIMCRNHHFLFDNFGFAINDDLSLEGIEGHLIKNKTHKIDLNYIQYHRNLYQIAKLE